MERKLLYGELFFVQIQTVKNPITCPRLCCSLRDIPVAYREIGRLSEQVKQKANLRDYNIQSRSSLCLKSQFGFIFARNQYVRSFTSYFS